MKLLVLISLLASGSLAIHDYVLNSANNNFTGFKVRWTFRKPIRLELDCLCCAGLQNSPKWEISDRFSPPTGGRVQGKKSSSAVLTTDLYHSFMTSGLKWDPAGPWTSWRPPGWASCWRRSCRARTSSTRSWSRTSSAWLTWRRSRLWVLRAGTPDTLWAGLSTTLWRTCKFSIFLVVRNNILLSGTPTWTTWSRHSTLSPPRSWASLGRGGTWEWPGSAREAAGARKLCG